NNNHFRCEAAARTGRYFPWRTRRDLFPARAVRFPSRSPAEAPMTSEEVLPAASSETDILRQQLMHAQRLSSVGTLASSVAHEFNNILTTILNYAKLGMRPDCPDATKQQAFEKILKGSNRAAVIISSMLGFARNSTMQRE